MDQQHVNKLRRWFSDYCSSFSLSNPADQKNFRIKEEHTVHVCSNIGELARNAGLQAAGVARAQVIALFHDIGRFPQYHQYRTFRDSISTNHALLGARVLREQAVLAGLPGDEQQIVLRAVELHNVFSVPDNIDADLLFYVKMIRDADKLDIWRVFIDYYAQPDDDRASAVGLGLPDNGRYSPEVLASFFQKKLVRLSDLRTLNDFKLLQLAWIFDLNFTCSLRLVLERSIIDGLVSTLPRSPEITKAVDFVRDYVDKEARVRSSPVILRS
jgi:hypothetical protein